MIPKHEHAFQVVVPGYNYWKRNIKCQTGCPVNTDSRGYVMAIADRVEGILRKALHRTWQKSRETGVQVRLMRKEMPCWRHNNGEIYV